MRREKKAPCADDGGIIPAKHHKAGVIWLVEVVIVMALLFIIFIH